MASHFTKTLFAFSFPLPLLSLSPSALFFRCRPLLSLPLLLFLLPRTFSPSSQKSASLEAEEESERARGGIEKGGRFKKGVRTISMGRTTDDSLRRSRGRNGGRTDGAGRLGVDAAVSVAICRREGFWRCCCCCCRCCRRRCSSWRRRERGPDAKKRGRKTERSPTILNRIRELQLSKLFVICYIGKLGIYLSSTIKVLLEVL